MTDNYENYRQEITEDIASCIDNMGCQPILFIGSGLSLRYFNAPNWEQLLGIMAKRCPLIKREFAYYKQRTPNLIDIGEAFAECYQEWAWDAGRAEFDASLFDGSQPPDIYFKSKVCEVLTKICPSSLDQINDVDLKAELILLQMIKPHSLITTNYDNFLQVLFPDYEPIIGQKVLRSSQASIGEIFKIHGCVSEPEGIVITRKDYDQFISNKKYLSAKLLTYFAEHPLLFIGYKAEDPNIVNILSDIDKILSEEHDLIPNIYILEWDSSLSPQDNPPRERLIPISESRSVRVKSIRANSFAWVFDAFGRNNTLDMPNPKILRSILARTYDLVRYDIPRKTIDVDYQLLEHALESDDAFAKVFGITTSSNATSINANHPFTISDLVPHLGYQKGTGKWHHVEKLIQKVIKDKGINIKSSDNVYHVAISTGQSKVHKYSYEALRLLELVRDGQPYELNI